MTSIILDHLFLKPLTSGRGDIGLVLASPSGRLGGTNGATLMDVSGRFHLFNAQPEHRAALRPLLGQVLARWYAEILRLQPAVTGAIAAGGNRGAELRGLVVLPGGELRAEIACVGHGAIGDVIIRLAPDGFPTIDWRGPHGFRLDLATIGWLGGPTVTATRRYDRGWERWATTERRNAIQTAVLPVLLQGQRASAWFVPFDGRIGTLAPSPD
jgi:hypothetical protein